MAGGPRVECPEDLVDRLAAPVGVARVDDDRQAVIAGDLDLRLEGAPLVGWGRRVAVVVDSGLADRPHLRVRGEPGDLRSRRVVEPAGRGRVAADRREHFLVPLGPGDRHLVGLVSQPDVEHPPHPGLQRRCDDLGLRPLAEEEMGVGVDHRAGASIFGKSGGTRSTFWPPGREPSSASSRDSSPSAVEQPLARPRQVGDQQQGRHPQPLDQVVEDLVEALRVGLVLGQLPRLASPRRSG